MIFFFSFFTLLLVSPSCFERGKDRFPPPLPVHLHIFPITWFNCLLLFTGMYQIREANQMVEEFMLAANVSVAQQILKSFPLCSLLRLFSYLSLNIYFGKCVFFFVWLPLWWVLQCVWSILLSLLYYPTICMSFSPPPSPFLFRPWQEFNRWIEDYNSNFEYAFGTFK